MGYDRHHAIVVTSYSIERLRVARGCAEQLQLTVSNILISPLNEWATFLVAPDGSKEGWDESDEGDRRRTAFVAWLDSQRWEDGSSPYDWVEVQYGDGDGVTRTVRHSDQKGRRKHGILEI